MLKRLLAWRSRTVSRAVFLVLWLGLTCGPAAAHWVDMSSADAVLTGRELTVQLTFPTALVPFADDKHAGELDAADIRVHQVDLKAAVNQSVWFADETGTRASLDSIEYDPQPVVPAGQMGPMGTHSTVKLHYQFAVEPKEVQVHYAWFLDSPTAHAMMAAHRGDQRKALLFTREDPDKAFGGRSMWPQVGSFLCMGVEHILTGYDHILFIICLLMAGGSLKYLIQVVTSFTLAHSITLTLAALNIVSLPPRAVECCIALSIAYVALENIYKKDATDKRYIVTFFFGLVHGLGFASILGEFKLAGAELATCLVSFNLGVEAGQAIIIVLASLVLNRLRHFKWEPDMRRWVSFGVTGVAGFWFVQRAFFGG